MSLYFEYIFDYIAPLTNAGVSIFGYPQNYISVFAVMPFDVGLTTSGTPANLDVKLTQGEVGLWTDGSYFKVADVQNLAGFNAVGVNLYTLYENA